MIQPHTPELTGDGQFTIVNAHSYQLLGDTVVDSSQNILANELYVNNIRTIDNNRNIIAKTFTGHDVNVNTLYINGKTLSDGNRNITANSINVNSLRVNGSQIINNSGEIVMNNFYSLMIPTLTLAIEQGLCSFAGVDMSDQNLVNVNLTGANLVGTNLAGSNLTGANLTDANLAGANLTRANLTGADLTRANLTGANLTGVTYSGTLFINTCVEDTLLADSVLLNTTAHDWILSILPDTGIQLQGTSYSVSLSGDGLVMAVSSPTYSRGTDLYIGQIIVYNFVDGNWTQKGTPIYGSQKSEGFGTSMSLNSNGDVIAIGSPYYDITTPNGNEGRVQIYEFGSDWALLGSQIVGGDPSDQSGISVDLTGSGLVVTIGSPGYSTSKGRVRIYHYDGSDWTQLGTDIVGSDDWVRSGAALSVSENIDGSGMILAIGAPFATLGPTGEFSQAGFVTVYEMTDDWVQKGARIDGSGNNYNEGMSLSLSANGLVLAISAPSYQDPITRVTGQVIVYQYNFGDWEQVGLPIVAIQNDELTGYSVSLSSDGTLLAISSSNLSYNGYASTGQVIIYELIASVWTQQGSPILGTINEQQLGTSVSLSKYGSKKVCAIGSKKFSNMFYTYSKLANGII